MTARCKCIPELGLTSGHPAFPSMHYTVRCSAAHGHPATEVEICGLPCGCIDVTGLVSHNLSKGDIVKTVKTYVKTAIRDNRGLVPSGRASVSTLLDALQNARETTLSSEDEGSSSEDSSSSSEEESVVDQGLNKHATSNVLTHAAKRQKTNVANASHEQCASSSTSSQSAFATQWMSNIANKCRDHIWLHAKPGDLQKQVSEIVSSQRESIITHLQATLQATKTGFVDNCKRSDIVSASVASHMMSCVDDEQVLSTMFADARKMLVVKVLAGIAEKRALWLTTM